MFIDSRGLTHGETMQGCKQTVLIADIGGTNCRFELWRIDSSGGKEHRELYHRASAHQELSAWCFNIALALVVVGQSKDIVTLHADFPNAGVCHISRCPPSGCSGGGVPDKHSQCSSFCVCRPSGRQQVRDDKSGLDHRRQLSGCYPWHQVRSYFLTNR